MSLTALSQFGALGVSAALVEVLKRLGLTEPTPIQVQAIPPALEGRDVLGVPRPAQEKPPPLSFPSLNDWQMALRVSHGR